MKVRLFICMAMVLLFEISAHAQKNSLKIAAEVLNPIDNTPTNIQFISNSELPALKGLNILKDYLEIKDSNITLVLSKSTKPYSGVVVDRYVEYYKNIKVEHGTYVITSKNGNISFMHGSIYKPETSISNIPILTENEALQKALSYIDAEVYMWQDTNAESTLKKNSKDTNATHRPKGSLVWIEDFNNPLRDKKLHLAYKFDIYAKKPMSRKLVYVNAIDGKILLEDAIIKHIAAKGKSIYSDTVSFETALLGSDYILYDSTRGSGIYTGTCHNSTTNGYNVINSGTFWQMNAAIDAHWGATQVYDYWKKVHNRNSYDDNGALLQSFVNYGIDFNNAFWNGSLMLYGDGSGIMNGGFDPLTSLDVCAHEIGHAICQYTSALVYQQESGAMNEGFSDIWAETIEHIVAPNKPKWQIGAEIGRVPLRSMSNPKLYNHPDTYNGNNWIYAGNGCNLNYDKCGVHINSGVLNKWYYLLADGGRGTNDMSVSYIVAGIGLTKAAQIAYMTELSLAPNDDYAKCRNTSISVATTLYGTCSPEVEAVTRAWNAVNVGTAFLPCGPQISFIENDTIIAKEIGSTICPSFKKLQIPLHISSSPVGGDAGVKLSVSGTALLGIDYEIVNDSVTFIAGSTNPQFFTINILDHGAIDSNKTLILDITISPNGSNVLKGNVYSQYKIVITNINKSPKISSFEDCLVGKHNITTTISSPFFSNAQSARSQFIILSSDLKASGLIANTAITDIGFNVIEKNSSRPFLGFTVKLGQTSDNSFNGAFLTGLSTVYSGSYITNTGWNKIPVSGTFQWDGVSNIVCEVCFADTIVSPDNTDRVAGSTSIDRIMAYNFSLTTDEGCVLPYANNKLSNTRPQMIFTQNVPATKVERLAPTDKTWDVHAGQNVYFYNSSDTSIIAGLSNISDDLGCTSVGISKQGVGFTAFKMDNNIKRSIKEFKILPTIKDTSITYDATLYFDTAEIGMINPSKMRVVGTNTLVDSGLNTANSQVVVPQVDLTSAYVSFKGSFKSFSRYFIIDNDFVLEPPTSIEQELNQIDVKVYPNPTKFTVTIENNKSINNVELTNVLGQKLLSETHNTNKVTIDISSLASGIYIIKVNNTHIQRIVKE